MTPKSRWQRGSVSPNRRSQQQQRPGGSGVRGSRSSLRVTAPDTTVVAGTAVDTSVADVKEDPSLSFEQLQDASVDLVIRPEVRHRLALRFELAADPTEAAPHYVMLLPKLRAQACCEAHSWRVEGASLRGKPVQTFEFEHFALVNVPHSAIPSLVVEHVFTSHVVQLQLHGSTDASLVPVPELSQAERLAALADEPGRADSIRELLENRGLARTDGERDLAFALRLGQALEANFSDNAVTKEATDDFLHLLPTLLLERGHGDSRALSAGFVYGLRAFGVPARMTLGLRFRPESEMSAAVQAQSEFFAEGVGWVPYAAGCSLRLLSGLDNDPEASSPTYFVPWHSVTPSRAEANEAAGVMRAASNDLEGALTRMHKVCERKGIKPGTVLTAAELASILGPALSLDVKAAERCVDQVLTFCKRTGNDGAALVDGYAALQLGSCPSHLGTGKGPCATGLAGVAFFKGGPYEDGVPLDIEALQETRLLLRNFRNLDSGCDCNVETWRSTVETRGTIWMDYEYAQLAVQ